MSKSVLGRGLNSLMGEGQGQRVQRSEGSGLGSRPADPRPIARGFETLLGRNENGAGPGSILQQRMIRQAASSSATLPSWYCFAADAALLLLAAILMQSSSGPPSAGRMVLAGSAIALGAVLALIPVLRSRPEEVDAQPACGRWIMTRTGSGATERIVMFRATEPFFAGEVNQTGGGRVTVEPLTLDGGTRLTSAQTQELAAEAAEAFSKLNEERARRIRATLV